MDELTADFLKIIGVCLVIFGLGWWLSTLPSFDEQTHQDHPGCQRIDIELHGAPGHDLNGYGWICPTPTGGDDGR